jgi:hypothetical protein
LFEKVENFELILGLLGAFFFDFFFFGTASLFFLFWCCVFPSEKHTQTKKKNGRFPNREKKKQKKGTSVSNNENTPERSVRMMTALDFSFNVVEHRLTS